MVDRVQPAENRTPEEGPRPVPRGHVGATYVGRDKLREPPVLAKTCELPDRELS